MRVIELAAKHIVIRKDCFEKISPYLEPIYFENSIIPIYI